MAARLKHPCGNCGHAKGQHNDGVCDKCFLFADVKKSDGVQDPPPHQIIGNALNEDPLHSSTLKGRTFLGAE